MAGWGGGPNSRWAALPRLEANPTLRPDHPGIQAPNRRRCTKDPCVCAWRLGQTLLHEISYDYSGAVSLGDQIRGGGTSARVGGMARLRLPTWHSGRLVCRDEATGTSDRNCFAPARILVWHRLALLRMPAFAGLLWSEALIACSQVELAAVAGVATRGVLTPLMRR